MRVAVSSAILKAERPRQAARALRDKLDQIRHIQPFGEMKA